MKRKLKAVIAGMLVAGMLAGCGSSGDSGTSGSNKDYDLYIFNSKGENADALEAATKAFGEEKGVKVKVFSLGSGTNSDEVLRTEMNSNAIPGDRQQRGGQDVNTGTLFCQTYIRTVRKSMGTDLPRSSCYKYSDYDLIHFCSEIHCSRSGGRSS